MLISKSENLILRHIEPKDAVFLLNLYNQAAFKQNIGDRGVNTLDDAKAFIEVTQKHYDNHGFWLYLVEQQSTGMPVGVNGLIQRDYLHAPDIGFAIDEQHWRKGYAFESSQAVVQHAIPYSIFPIPSSSAALAQSPSHPTAPAPPLSTSSYHCPWRRG